MTEHTFASFETIHEYPLSQAIEDGTVVAVTACPGPPPTRPKPLHEISSLDGYLLNYGKTLGRKAIQSLDPLHVPNVSPMPDMDDLLRDPFEAQKHVIAAVVRMFQTTGSGFIVGTMGTGKTLLGMSAVFKHAQLSRKQGGKGGRFRCLVLAPEHLIAKWKREIEETIPEATVYYFGSLNEMDRKARAKIDGKTGQAPALADLIALLDKGYRGRWSKPDGPEFYVIGRDQIKWLPGLLGTSDPYKGFNCVGGLLGGKRVVSEVGQLPDGTPITAVVHEHGAGSSTPVQKPLTSKTIVVDQEPAVDPEGRPVKGPDGRQKIRNLTAQVFTCPSCGCVIRDKKSVPVSGAMISKAAKANANIRCENLYLQHLPSADGKNSGGLDVISPVPDRFRDKSVGSTVSIGTNRYVVKKCGEPLWSYTSQPYRFMLGRIIQKKFRRFFDYLLIDEAHEHAKDDSGQSLAASKLIGAANHVLALTGTIIGGYAKDLFALLLRICPETLKAEGFEWGKDLPFSEVYGRIDRIVKVSEEGASATIAKNVRSMRRAKTGKATERKAIRPGVMPTLFGRHMIGNTVFITLDEMAEGLPDLFEYIGGECPPPPEPPPADASHEDREKYQAERDAYERMKAFYVDTACEMEPTQKAEYDRIEATLEFASKELLRRGSMKLLGTMLATTLGYPDFCYSEWGIEDEKLIKALNMARAEGINIPEHTQHVVGYWDKPGLKDITNWMGVLTPKVLDATVVYPKEQRLIDICKLHRAAGHQTWVYVQMTGKRNVLPRLRMLLEREGLRVGLLKSGDVDPKEREEWIAAHGRAFDVMMCFPKMVSTGLDLFSKVQGGHNFNAIVFYETGYKLNDMRQAARRAWRIGQPRDCYIYYLYYKGTMQHRAMSLMSKKMAAALALEGEFSEDGLAAMAGEDNMQMAMAKSMSEAIDQADMQRSWSKVKSGEKKKVRKTKQPGEALVEFAAPKIKVPAPMPEPEKLAALSSAKRWVFKRMAMKPNNVLGLSDLKCVTETCEALVAAGLAERVGDGWRCSLDERTLQDVLTWFKLYHEDSTIYVPLGIVKARQPGGPEHYVRCTNHAALENILEILPVQGFPGVNSKPLYAKQARQDGWVLMKASKSDRAKLREKGFFREGASQLYEPPIEAQMAAATILERQAKPVPLAAKDDITALAERFAQADAGMWAAARAMAEDAAYDAQLWSTPESVVEPEPVAEPEPSVLGTWPCDVMDEESERLADEEEMARRQAEHAAVEAMIVSTAEPEPVEGKARLKPVERPKLKVHQPAPEKKVHAVFDDIEFDDDLIAKMMANIASHGMSASDIFG